MTLCGSVIGLWKEFSKLAGCWRLGAVFVLCSFGLELLRFFVDSMLACEMLIFKFAGCWGGWVLWMMKRFVVLLWVCCGVLEWWAVGEVLLSVLVLCLASSVVGE